jgi:hypothetical protein
MDQESGKKIEKADSKIKKGDSEPRKLPSRQIMFMLELIRYELAPPFSFSNLHTCWYMAQISVPSKIKL